MSELKVELRSAVAFIISEVGDCGCDENWEKAGRLIEGIDDATIQNYLSQIPVSARRRCAPTGIDYLAERICLGLRNYKKSFC